MTKSPKDRPRLFAFDFDGTITRSDSFLRLIAYTFGYWRLSLAIIALSPRLLLMKLRPEMAGKTKERLFCHFFRGMDVDDFSRLCHKFACHDRGIIRPKAMELLASLNSQGERIVIVSASMEMWIAPFLHDFDIQYLCTVPEITDGKLTGHFASPNCKGPEKVRRLAEAFPDLTQYSITAFGDSSGDRQMLSMADTAYYKPFR